MSTLLKKFEILFLKFFSVKKNFSWIFLYFFVDHPLSSLRQAFSEQYDPTCVTIKVSFWWVIYLKKKKIEKYVFLNFWATFFDKRLLAHLAFSHNWDSHFQSFSKCISAEVLRPFSVKLHSVTVLCGTTNWYSISFCTHFYPTLNDL